MGREEGVVSGYWLVPWSKCWFPPLRQGTQEEALGFLFHIPVYLHQALPFTSNSKVTFLLGRQFPLSQG